MTDWRTSSYSRGNGGACVEVASSDQAVKVRDTQNRSAGDRSITTGEWTAFLESVKRPTP